MERLPLSVRALVVLAVVSFGMIGAMTWTLEAQERQWEAREAAMQQAHTEQIAQLMEQYDRRMATLVDQNQADADAQRSVYERELAASGARVRALAWEVRQARALAVVSAEVDPGSP